MGFSMGIRGFLPMTLFILRLRKTGNRFRTSTLKFLIFMKCISLMDSHHVYPVHLRCLPITHSRQILPIKKHEKIT